MSENRIYLDHIGVACHDLKEASRFWQILGLLQNESDDVVAEQGVTVRFLSTSADDPKQPRIELLQPLGDDTTIGKFLRNRGEGIQQICFRVDDLDSMIALLVKNGVHMIDETPRKGSHGSSIAFVHPKSTGGVLVELCQS
ncbi:MAG: methylmalonyl-CoA epimerase [Candidatus Poseidoniales archaeon]|jgi:methylmalonyl-CoA/ethylmalonyl-CoA epimerase